MQKEELFRKKSLDKLTSPEELGDYIKVAKASYWVLLAALTALLIAGIAWACFYTITRSVEASGYVYENNAYCYVSPEDYQNVAVGDKVLIDGAEFSVTAVNGFKSGDEIHAFWAENGLSEADVTVGFGVQNGEGYYGEIVIAADSLPNGGNVNVSVVYEEISPIKLVIGG